jgi:hypothetical protein
MMGGLAENNQSRVEMVAAPGSERLPADFFEGKDRAFIGSGLSLALIGNASDRTPRRKIMRTRGVFDKETRRKPLAFAADAVRYGI